MSRILPTILSLVLGVLVGSGLSKMRKSGEEPVPSRLVPKRNSLERVEEAKAADPVSTVALATSFEEFDVAEAGGSSLAQGQARELHLARRCREVPVDGLAAMFDELVGLDTKVDKSLALRILGQRWAKVDPQAASDAAATLKSPLRALVERSMWKNWAQHDLIGFRVHMDDLRRELNSNPPDGGIPFGLVAPWIQADPSQAMDVMLEKDWYFFRDRHSLSPPDAAPPADARPLAEAPLGNTVWAAGSPGMAPALEGWFRSDIQAAKSWTDEALGRDNIPPRLRFHAIHHLNTSGFHAVAADLADKHLTEDLQRIAQERIQNRWQVADPEAAEEWQSGRLTPSD